MSLRFALFLLFVACGFLLVTSCTDREISSYQIEKETPAAPLSRPGANARANLPAQRAGAPAGAINRTEAPTLVWAAPTHWKPKPASAMRWASYGVPTGGDTEADLSISVLGGSAGGLPANVNRWRTQLGLPEQSAGELAHATETIPAGGLTFTLVDLAGQSGGAAVRMLAAVAEFDGQSWFFKLTGPDGGVAAEKPAFVAFLRTVKTR